MCFSFVAVVCLVVNIFLLNSVRCDCRFAMKSFPQSRNSPAHGKYGEEEGKEGRRAEIGT